MRLAFAGLSFKIFCDTSHLQLDNTSLHHIRGAPVKHHVDANRLRDFTYGAVSRKLRALISLFLKIGFHEHLQKVKN